MLCVVGYKVRSLELQRTSDYCYEVTRYTVWEKKWPKLYRIFTDAQSTAWVFSQLATGFCEVDGESVEAASNINPAS